MDLMDFRINDLAYREITINSLAIMLNLKSSRTLSAKAKRQGWPKMKRSHAGSPVHLYDLSTLPDDVQIAWSSWDKEQYKTAVEKELLKGDDARPDTIPRPVTYEQAMNVLQWPERNSYFKQPDKSLGKPGKLINVYDGHSKGLCEEAAGILRSRFQELDNSTTYSKDSIESVVAENNSEKYLKNPSGDESYTLSLLKEKELMVEKLKEEIAELKEDKRILNDYRKELKNGQDRLIKEKDRRLEEKDRLIENQEKTIQQLREKLKAEI
ncbi:hypothetical protein KKA14_09385 [bacterium]|nr:hypothetical protein [bacterium]